MDTCAVKPPVAPTQRTVRTSEGMGEISSHTPDDVKARKKSRSPAANQDLTEVLTVGEGSARRKSRRKSKRRSSFVGGRITKTLPTYTGSASDLHKFIPNDLPEDSRMEILARKALEYSLGKLKEEFPDMPNYDAFKAIVTESGNANISRLRDEGFFKGMVYTGSEKEEKESAEEVQHLEAMIAKAVQETEKYKQETEMWDSLLQQYEQEAQEAERLAEEAKQGQMKITAPPEGLTERQRKFLDSAPPYVQYVERLEHTGQTLLLYMTDISRIAKEHDKLFREARQTVEKYAEVIHDAVIPKELQESDFLLQHPPENTE